MDFHSFGSRETLKTPSHRSLRLIVTRSYRGTCTRFAFRVRFFREFVTPGRLPRARFSPTRRIRVAFRTFGRSPITTRTRAHSHVTAILLNTREKKKISLISCDLRLHVTYSI